MPVLTLNLSLKRTKKAPKAKTLTLFNNESARAQTPTQQRNSHTKHKIPDDVLSLATSEVTTIESIITVTPSKEAALDRAKVLRRMAEQAMVKRGVLEKERESALKGKQFGRAFALKCLMDEAEVEAGRLHRKAARRYQGGQFFLFLSETFVFGSDAYESVLPIRFSL